MLGSLETTTVGMEACSCSVAGASSEGVVVISSDSVAMEAIGGVVEAWLGLIADSLAEGVVETRDGMMRICSWSKAVGSPEGGMEFDLEVMLVICVALLSFMHTVTYI